MGGFTQRNGTGNRLGIGTVGLNREFKGIGRSVDDGCEFTGSDF